MRRILSAVGDLVGGLCLVAVIAGGLTVLIESRLLVRLLFVLPSLAALAIGYWRGRASLLESWLVLILLNLPALTLAGWMGLSEGAWKVGALPVLTAACSAIGVWTARGSAALASGRRWLAALVVVLLPNVALALAAPAFATSLIVSRELNQPAPEFRVALLDGGAVSARELRGRVVVLDFWTSWCQPCRREFPELEKVYARFRDRPGVAFYAVDADRGDTPEKARRYFRDAGYRLPVAYDHGSKVYEAFSAPGFPTLVVIDRAGRLRFRHTGFVGAEDFAGNLTRLIERLLREG